MASSRIKNSITNILTGAFGQILNIVLNFALRTVFLYSLGKEYAGINGVLSGVLQVLNLANLGIDGAIVYAMYKPLAEKNTEQAKALVAFYRRAYRIIGSVIVVVGVALIPVLPYLLKDSTELVDIRIVYCLYLAETVSTYWFFAYLGTVLQADQRKYVVTRITYFTQTLSTIVKAAVLFALRGTPALCFYVFTGIGAAFTVVQNLLTRVRCRRARWCSICTLNRCASGTERSPEISTCACALWKRCASQGRTAWANPHCCAISAISLPRGRI